VREPDRKSYQVWHTLSRDFTVLPAHPSVYPWMEWTMPALAFSAEAGSFTVVINPGGMKGWGGLGSTMLSRQTTQDWYVTTITVVSCSNCYASISNWSARPQRQTHDVESPSLKAWNVSEFCFISKQSPNKFRNASADGFSEHLLWRNFLSIYCSCTASNRHVDVCAP